MLNISEANYKAAAASAENAEAVIDAMYQEYLDSKLAEHELQLQAAHSYDQDAIAYGYQG